MVSHPTDQVATWGGTFDYTRPIYVQLAAVLRARILASSGDVSGARVHAAPVIAQQFGVSTKTALRALRVLRNEGVIDFRRGRPIRIKNVSAIREKDETLSGLMAAIARALDEGFTQAQLISLVDESLASAVRGSHLDEQHARVRALKPAETSDADESDVDGEGDSEFPTPRAVDDAPQRPSDQWSVLTG
ncbi:helix-turn-helix domain-containing protein [Actinomycetes bacterium KLBMP 9759]